MAMIEVFGLTKEYAGVRAVDRVEFTCEKGEIVGLLGSNGAGKTTTMRMLTCYIPPTGGTARMAGFDILRQSIEVRRRIGYLPESVPLYTEMRVREYLAYRARLKGVSRRDLKSRIDEVLGKCGLTDVGSRIIGQLSKGYRQRVGLADAVIHHPEIVILDEPTIGLDPHQIRLIRDLIKELGEKHTVLLSTHILSEVEMLCGRVIIINRGRIVAMDTPDQLVRQLAAKNRIRVEVHGKPADVVIRSLRALPGVKDARSRGADAVLFEVENDPTKDVRREIFGLAAREGWDLRELAFERATLEDAFVEFTAAPATTPAAAGIPQEVSA